MSIAVLTYGSEYAERILLALAVRGLVPTAVLVTQDAELVPEVPDLTLAWQGLAREIRTVGPAKGEGLVKALEAVAPDFLLLGGTKILDDDVLAVPRVATLNVHPGLLPWIRGVDAVEHSMLRAVPAGLSAHRVDAGIDTGPVLVRELVPVSDVDTVASIRRKAYERGAQLLAELMVVAADQQLPPAVPQTERFPYCPFLPDDERASVEDMVRDGAAVRLYHQWRATIGGNVVPPRLGDHPPVDVQPLRGGA